MATEHTSEQQEAEERDGREGLEKEERQPVQGHIAIKGTRHGLLLTLEPGTPFSDLLTALSQRLSEAPSFFRGASLSVDTTSRALETGERIQLETLLACYQMSVAAPDMLAIPSEAGTLLLPALPGRDYTPLQVFPQQDGQMGSSRDIENIENIEDRGDGENMGQMMQVEQVEQAGKPDWRESDETLFLRRTVRSGQAIHHHSNVVVLGDVNAGAEIVAEGDIIVWGVLRGMVHAGYPDNEQALVCSLSLAPVQLRIAHLLSRPPEDFEAQPRPEVAAIRNGQIVVEAWVNGRPPRK